MFTYFNYAGLCLPLLDPSDKKETTAPTDNYTIVDKQVKTKSSELLEKFNGGDALLIEHVTRE